MEPNTTFKILQGWMWKKGNFINKSYKKRWFILFEQNKLSYFENDKSVKENGEINLCHISAISQDEEYKNEFSLHTTNRIWQLKCDDNVELNKWLKYLKKYALPEIIQSGYLYKKNKTKWEKFYFQLNVLKQLRYYDNKNKQKFISIIYVENIAEIKFCPKSYNGRCNILQLLMVDNSVYTLSAESNEIRLIWHKFLTEMMINDWNDWMEEEKEKELELMDNNDDIVLGIKYNGSYFHRINVFCEEKETNYTQCTCLSILRLSVILRIYHKWFNLNNKANFIQFNGGMYSFINHFLTKYESRLHAAYDNTALLNDFHHILRKHELNYVLLYIQQEMNGICCNINNCKIIKRHYRDRSWCITKQIRNCLFFGYGGNSKEVNTQNILDMIHCHIFHSYDTLQCSPYDINQIQESFDDDDDDEKDNDDHDVNQRELMHIKSILNTKQIRMSNILSTDRFRLKSCKFSLDINNKSKLSENGNIQNDINYNDGNTIHIGDRLYYWRKYENSLQHEFYICPKYKSLKEEIRSNSIYPISKFQFNDIVLRSSNLIQCNEGKKLISYHGWNNKKYQYDFKRYYNIDINRSINQSHLQCLLFYCNFSALHYHFIHTFDDKTKPLLQTANFQQQYVYNWKRRHSEFGHFARLLRELCEIYGTEININNQEKSYFHLIKTEYLFKSFICKFNVILSTTNDLSVGFIYSSSKTPLLLNLKKYGNIGCYGFDCQWISDFCNESEWIFTGSHCMEIESIIHIQLAQNYDIYINAMSIINKFINGQPPNSALISMDYQKAINKLLSTELEKYSSPHLNGNNIKMTIPPYVECLFHFQCLNVKQIDIDINTLFDIDGDNNCNFVSIKHIFMSNNCNWIRIDLFIRIFPNIEQIKINCKFKMEINMDTYYKLIDVIKEKTKLVNIEFIEPSKLSVSLEKVIDEFQDECNLSRSWKIKQDKDTIIIEKKSKQDQDCLIM